MTRKCGAGPWADEGVQGGGVEAALGDAAEGIRKQK